MARCAYKSENEQDKRRKYRAVVGQNQRTASTSLTVSAPGASVLPVTTPLPQVQCLIGCVPGKCLQRSGRRLAGSDDVVPDPSVVLDRNERYFSLRGVNMLRCSTHAFNT